MSDPNIPDVPTTPEADESFGDLLSQFERGSSRKVEGGKGLEGTVVAVSADSVFVDIGYKSEGVLPFTVFQEKNETVKPGDKLLVTVKGRNQEGYYELARGKVERPTDWAALEKAFAEKATVAGTVTGVVKGGVSVDVGVRAFMPASRTGTRDAAELEKLVGQEIRCRITKLDVTEEDVVVDRRVIAEEEDRAIKERRYSEIKEGDTVTGTVRSLTDYGAFVDLGGVDGLLHVAEISWSRISKPADVLAVGQQVEVVVLKVDTEKRRISLGMKQLQAHPWDAVAGKYNVGDRVRGTVSRVVEFGAFVELEPGVEGLIHVSELSWSKKIRIASDVLKPGETVEVIVLGVNPAERRIALGLKQAVGDPWAEAAAKYPVGSVVEGPVSSLAKFGAFVQLAEGVEGMIHIGDITAEKRLNHPQDMLKLGQRVQAQVLEIDTERRRMRLGMKQLIPTSLEEYIQEHQPGDSVTGRMIEISEGIARVELGEGVFATCKMSAAQAKAEPEKPAGGKADLSSLTSMLQARWKSGSTASAQSQTAATGQVRSFRIVALDPAAKKIELELA
jgi:small subunit ribosomal protein S1